MTVIAPYHRAERLVATPFQLPPERLPLLLTGIAGVAGYNALHYFRTRYPGQVVGIRHSPGAAGTVVFSALVTAALAAVSEPV